MDFKSKEEQYFSWYLEELRENEFIYSWEYEPFSFNLSEEVRYSYTKRLKTKSKIMDKVLLHKHEYTPDFVIEWTDKARGVLARHLHEASSTSDIFFLMDDDRMSYIDIKPNFDKHNMTRLFIVNQKWVFTLYEKYVQKVIITGSKNALFQATFTPERYLTTDKTGHKRALEFEPVNLEEFLNLKE